MQISRFRVQNFSSFVDTGWTDLGPRFNLFVGPNNSGKSALLKSLRRQIPDAKHRTDASIPDSIPSSPLVEIDFEISVSELMERLELLGVRAKFPAGSRDDRNGIPILDATISDPSRTVSLQFDKTPQGSNPRNGASIENLRASNQLTADVSGNSNALTHRITGHGVDNLNLIVSDDRSTALFYFSAERLNVATHPFGEQRSLNADASNLPAVLAYIQAVRAPLFEQIERQLSEIIPGVERVTIAPTQQHFEILIWPKRNADRSELSFSLQESGTGLGQVLAILTAAGLHSNSIIVIDEINTFLHPGAVKKLLGILNSFYGHHQYIISSHSPDVISFPVLDRIYEVSRSGFESSVAAIDVRDAATAKAVSQSLGFSMMDVLGNDRIVWVEGPTEELIFPELARAYTKIDTEGLTFCAVADTSAFSNRGGSEKQVVELYENAGRRLAPLLKGMSFGLDRERLNDEAVVRLERSKRKLRFLKRRCVENYFLDPEALSAALFELDEQVEPDACRTFLLEHGGDREFAAVGKWKGDLSAPDWLKAVDGARLLSSAFGALTENRQEFRKTRDVPQMTRFLIEHRPEALSELAEFVKRLLETASKNSPP